MSVVRSEYMTQCIICGKENSTCLCDECRQSADIEKLCLQLIEYKPGSGENTLWDSISEKLDDARNFKNLVFALSDELPTPRGELMRILCIAGDYDFVPKQSRQWLYETYAQIKDGSNLSDFELNRIRGLVQAGYVMDYRYQQAEEIAILLSQYEKLPKHCYCTLGEYYTKTRRYEDAEELLNDGLIFYGEDPAAKEKLEKLLSDNSGRRNAAECGRKEYLPAGNEAQQKYIAFMAELGIEAELPRPKRPTPIPRDQYPEPIETRDADFDSFVAFDVETTGFSTKIDSIIEIGAIKVIDGKIAETKEFVFQELVKPYDRKVSPEITELTGITPDDVKDARRMWEVTPDFMNFVGDMVLVGYNSVAFDSRFLARAGRYSNLIITNKHFDVMHYARGFYSELGIDTKQISLTELAEKLEIENPQAHRALADAITTARVFLKLKKMAAPKELSLDDLLSDLDEW